MRFSFFSSPIAHIDQQFLQDKVAALYNQLSLQDLPMNYQKNFDQEIKRETLFRVRLLNGENYIVNSFSDLVQTELPEPIKYLLGKHLCQTPADENEGTAIIHQMHRAIFDYYFLNRKLLSGFSSSEFVLQQTESNKFILKISGDCRIQEDPTPIISPSKEQSTHLTLQCYNFIFSHLKQARPYVLAMTHFISNACKSLTSCARQAKNGLNITHEYLFEMKGDTAYGKPYQTIFKPCVYPEPSTELDLASVSPGTAAFTV